MKKINIDEEILIQVVKHLGASQWFSTIETLWGKYIDRLNYTDKDVQQFFETEQFQSIISLIDLQNNASESNIYDDLLKCYRERYIAKGIYSFENLLIWEENTDEEIDYLEESGKPFTPIPLDRIPEEISIQIRMRVFKTKIKPEILEKYLFRYHLYLFFQKNIN